MFSKLKMTLNPWFRVQSHQHSKSKMTSKTWLKPFRTSKMIGRRPKLKSTRNLMRKQLKTRSYMKIENSQSLISLIWESISKLADSAWRIKIVQFMVLKDLFMWNWKTIKFMRPCRKIRESSTFYHKNKKSEKNEKNWSASQI